MSMASYLLSRRTFELTGLPPGNYTVEAWHPVLGMRSVAVKLARGAKPATVSLSFAARP